MEREELQRLLGSNVFARAERYCERGRVRDLQEQPGAPGVRFITASVVGTDRYAVRVWLREDGEFVSADCTCPKNARGDGPLCKHIGAVLLQHAKGGAGQTAPGLQQLLQSDRVQKGSDLLRSGNAGGPHYSGSNLSDLYEDTPFSDEALAERDLDPGTAPGVMTLEQYDEWIRTTDELLAQKREQEERQKAARSYASNVEALLGRKWRTEEPETDEGALTLLRDYRTAAERADQTALHFGATMPEGSVTLEPELLLDALRNDQMPELRLRISAGGRQYVVRELPEFIAAFDTGREITYGKKLSFVQDLAAYDEPSRRLIGLVRRQLALMEYSRAVLPGGRGKTVSGSLPLAAQIMDELVALYREEGLMGGYELHDGPPPIRLTAARRRGGVGLSASPYLHWCSGGTGFYYYSDSDLWAVTPAQHRRLEPLFGLLSGRELFFTGRHASEFCSYVMPEIRDLVTLEDPERLLLDQMPLPPVVQFYLDCPEQMRVIGYPVFQYGEDAVTPFASPPAELVRDLRAERRAVAVLEQYFAPITLPQEVGQYAAEGEKAVIRLLDEGIPALLAAGEVYMTDAFRGMQAPRPKVSIGVSVAGSVLDLTVDTGEFPADELKALLASLRQKKTYHRLRDGRLLRIDPALQPLEELDQVLELSGADLQEGHAQVPLYRAPSLDKALAGQKEIRLRRDDAFRAISRNFRSVADSAYALPESLNGILRKYQRTGYRWLRTLDAYGMGGILADDMGLGKTLQVLAYLLSAKEGGETRPSLIVCPASLVLNWAAECEKFTPQLRCLVMDGTAAHRAALAERFDEYDLIVTGYDLLRRDEELYAAHTFNACILDEAQAIKNHSTQKYEAVCRVQSRVRFALTGTPIENRLSELWSIFSFLMPGYLYSYAEFKKRFEKPIVADGDEQLLRRLNQLTSPFVLRRMKNEVLTELPPKVENVTKVALEEEQKKLYLASVLDAKTRMKTENTIEVFAVLTRLRQICCDPRLMAENWGGGSAKLEACAELIQSAVDGGHQILLFSQFTSMLSLLEKRLDQMGITHFTLQGSTPKPERARLVREFNDRKASVFLISLKAGGTGLNLTSADIVIHYDPWWNMAAQNQATDRAYRIGQTNTVQVYKLIAKDTIEEKILEMQQAKHGLAESITGSAEGSIMTMSRDEILRLLD